MPAFKLKQLHYEIDTWKRTLEFVTIENIFMKNRLAEVLKDKFNTDLLEKFEHFQNRFIKLDDLVGFLRNDVAEFDMQLATETFADNHITNGLEIKLNNLRSNIINAEMQFSNLNIDFNNYLLEYM